MSSDPITSWQIEGEKVEAMTDFIFLDSKITADGDCSCEIKRHVLLGKKAMTNLDSVLRSRNIHYFAEKGTSSQSYDFSSSYVQIWELDHKDGWVSKIGAFELWCWRRLLRIPWIAKIKPVNPKGNQSWIFIGRTDVEAEAPILWPPDANSQLILKESDVRKDRGQEKGMTEDKMVGWHHQIKGCESE